MSQAKPLVLPPAAALLVLTEWARLARVTVGNGREVSTPNSSYLVTEADKQLRLVVKPNAFKTNQIRERLHHLTVRRAEVEGSARSLRNAISRGVAVDGADVELTAILATADSLDAEIEAAEASLVTSTEIIDLPYDLAGIRIEVRG